MSGKRIIAGLREAVAFVGGRTPARITYVGHRKPPEASAPLVVRPTGPKPLAPSGAAVLIREREPA